MDVYRIQHRHRSSIIAHAILDTCCLDLDAHRPCIRAPYAADIGHFTHRPQSILPSCAVASCAVAWIRMAGVVHDSMLQGARGRGEIRGMVLIFPYTMKNQKVSHFQIRRNRQHWRRSSK